MKTKELAYAGIGAAIVFVSGYYLKFNVLNGYYNLEDSVILILAFVMESPIVFACSIGAGLCDLLSGSAIYTIPSMLIYGICGISAFYIIKSLRTKIGEFKAYFSALIVCEIIVIMGYVLTFSILYGLSDFRGVSLFYLVQAGINIVTALIAYPFAVRIKKALKPNHNY